MRDIRRDLEERLAMVLAAQAIAKRSLVDLENQEATLRYLLKEEEARWIERIAENGVIQTGVTVNSTPHPTRPQRIRSNNRPRSPLAMLLIELLSSGHPLSLSELVQRAEMKGFDFGSKNPNRVIHFALIGMKQSQIVARSKDGKWSIPEAVEQRGLDDALAEEDS